MGQTTASVAVTFTAPPTVKGRSRVTVEPLGDMARIQIHAAPGFTVEAFLAGANLDAFIASLQACKDAAPVPASLRAVSA